jgi:FAD/FMN-containing dehydrogenase
MMDTHKNGISFSQLRNAIKGEIITPEDDEYNDARRVFYRGFDRHPALIVRVADAHDVAQVIAVARESGMELAVRSGGHSVPGHGVSEGGIVLDLSRMKGLQIDVTGSTAWAESGLTAGEYTTATSKHGLVTGFGDTPSVGIGGLTTGGGIGYLVRKYGLTIDDLLAAEMVTADGQFRYVDADTNPDLFWAIRGGGGNFGVVTRFKFRLHELDQVVGGMLILPATAEILRKIAIAAKAAPDELSAIVNIMHAPPMPMIPAEYEGQLIAMVQMLYAGDVEAGEQAVAPFREIVKPIADVVGPMRYSEIYKLNEIGEDEAPIEEASRSLFIRTFEDRTADAIVHYLKTAKAFAVAQFRVLGGAMARVPVEATAFAHRQQPIMLAIGAVFEKADEIPVHDAWVTEFAAALSQNVEGVYANFLRDEGEARIREAYPGATWDRLRAIKAQYDPTNLFRLNQNIPPAVR